MNLLKITFRLLCIISLCGIIGSCQSQKIAKTDFNEKIPVQQLQEDFYILRSSIEKSHAGLYAYISKKELDQAFDDISASIQSPMTSIEFFRRVSPLLKLIGNGHTKFFPPKNYNMAINSVLPRFPLAIHRHKDTVYVLRNLSADETILPGTILKSINGIPAIEWVKKIADNLSRDAEIISFPEYIVEQDFSGTFAYFIGTPTTYDLELIDINKESKQVQVKGLNSAEIGVNYAARYSDFIKKKQAPSSLPLSFQIKNNIGILTIKSFSIPTFKKNKQNYKDFFNDVFAQVASNQVQDLILDIRDNGGGYPEVIIELYSYLAEVPYIHDIEAYTITKKLPNRKYYKLAFWENQDIRTSLRLKKEGDIYRVTKNAGKKTYPLKPKRFQGELYVLTNPYTLSAASDLAGMLKEAKRGIFIGGIAGGHPIRCTSWIFPDLVLPNTKVKARIPVVHTSPPAGTESPSDLEKYIQGILPDYFIKNSIDDAISAKDAALKFTFDLIKKD